MSGGRLQWQEAQLSPGRLLELARVSGKFSCTPAGALALTLSRDSHQLSLTGQGTLSPDGRYAFHGKLQTRQLTPALLTCSLPNISARMSRDASPAAAGEMVITGDIMTLLSAFSLQFPCYGADFLFIFGLTFGSF